MLKDHKVLVTGLTGNLGGSIDKMLSENNDVWATGKLAGKTPRYAFSDQVNYPSLKLDPTRRKAITGPCQVDWRDGVARMYETFRTQSGAAFFSNATVSPG